MAPALPLKLKKEPLIDAVFEVRFASTAPVSVILPGYLFNRLDGAKSIEALPIAQIPKAMRDADPNLKFQPLSRLTWDQFLINIGDFSVSISCKYPYLGWSSFKPAIVKVMTILAEVNLVEAVERYSLKYIDLIPSIDLQQQVAMINFDVTIAGHRLEKEPFQLRMDIPRDGLINVVQVVSSATATLNDGTTKVGLIVDVDTILKQDAISMNSLLDDFSNKLDAIHQTNKAMFFDCLTPKTIESLEPVYE